ncbi:MAG: hypothetical protein OQJ87_02370, partial [Rhodospirillales bacterium]|nr:hypothetical protein [Rhodospirillales bacterium]
QPRNFGNAIRFGSNRDMLRLHILAVSIFHPGSSLFIWRFFTPCLGKGPYPCFAYGYMPRWLQLAQPIPL